MKLTIKIDDDCIENGIADDATFCPAALGTAIAFADSGIETGVVETDGAVIEVWDPDNAELIYVAPAPGEINRFVSEFDEGLRVEPVAVEVEFEAVTAGAA